MMADFLQTAVFSALIGAGVGILITLLFKHMRFLTHNPVNEIAIVFVGGYLSYLISYLAGLSGIVSLLVAGIMMGHYAWFNISDNAKLCTGFSFQTLSLVAESFLFVYLGLSSFDYSNKPWSLSLFFLMIGIILVARFFGVYVLSWIYMIFTRGKFAINHYQMTVLWFAGLIRGAIAFALVLSLGNSVNPIVLSTVYGLVIATTCILGGLMPAFISLILALQERYTPKEKLIDSSVIRTLIEENIITVEKEKGESAMRRSIKGFQNKMHYYWKRFDDRYIKPLLIADIEGYMSAAKNKAAFRYNQENEEEFKEMKSLHELFTD